MQLFDIIKPAGHTPIGNRLEELLHNYFDQLDRAEWKGVKPLNIIVITDGEPSAF